MVIETAAAEYGALEAMARESSAQLPADPSEWPKGWVFQFHTVLAFRA